ncbi:hypothetical protein D3C75_1153490 [compost metagenome]
MAVYLAVKDDCRLSIRRSSSVCWEVRSVNLLLRSVTRLASVPVVPTYEAVALVMRFTRPVSPVNILAISPAPLTTALSHTLSSRLSRPVFWSVVMPTCAKLLIAPEPEPFTNSLRRLLTN